MVRNPKTHAAKREQKTRVRAIMEYRRERASVESVLEPFPEILARARQTLRAEAKIPPFKASRDFVLRQDKIPGPIAKKIREINSKLYKKYFRQTGAFAIGFGLTAFGAATLASLPAIAPFAITGGVMTAGVSASAIQQTRSYLGFVRYGRMTYFPLRKPEAKKMLSVNKWVLGQEGNAIAEKRSQYRFFLFSPQGEIVFTNYPETFLRKFLLGRTILKPKK